MSSVMEREVSPNIHKSLENSSLINSWYKYKKWILTLLYTFCSCRPRGPDPLNIFSNTLLIFVKLYTIFKYALHKAKVINITRRSFYKSV